MTQNTGYILNGLPIEYIGVNIYDHFLNGRAFIATKALEMFLIEYSQTGKVIYSNEEIMERLGCSRRGLQTALNDLEAVDQNGNMIYNIIKRTYTDETKRVRTGIEVNIEVAIKWLSAKHKDVDHLERGNLFKHFVNQSVIVIKKYAKKLRRAIERVKTNKNKEKWRAIIADLNKEKLEHETYIKKCIKRATKAILSADVTYSEHELKHKYFETMLGWGLTNPPNQI
jgi:hypothetical protein